MRKSVCCFFIICSIGLLASCHNDSKEGFIENFGNFITEVDSSAKNYSEADWQNADEQFTDYKDNQFALWENIMTPDEKKKVNEMIGKYQALQVIRGINDIKNQVNDVIDQTKTMFNELAKDTTLTQ